jgi:hypothetical protein
VKFNNLVVIGKNSSVYSLIQDSLPPHKAYSFHQFQPENVKNKIILFLSFPKDKNEGLNEYYNTLNLVCRMARKVIYISTFGLNGINSQLTSHYYYLREKRRSEIEVIKSDGVILRCGSFFKNVNHRGLNFVTEKTMFSKIAEFYDRSGIYNFGVPKNYKKLTLFEHSLKFLLAKSALILKKPLLFKLFHLVGILTPNKGYSLHCNNMLQKTGSVGAGLSTFNHKFFNDYVYVIPPRLSRIDDVSLPLGSSKKVNGFGSRWHGVSPLNYDGEIGIIKVPLVPPGRLKLFLKTLFSQIIYMDITSYREHRGFIELVGVCEDGYSNTLALKNSILNSGLINTLQIISQSSSQKITGSLGSQSLMSIWPIKVNQKMKFEKFIFSYRRTVFRVIKNNVKYLAITRPKLSSSQENTFINGKFTDRLKTFILRIDVDLIKWLLSSKFGFDVINSEKCQVDFQVQHQCQFELENGKFTFKQDNHDNEYLCVLQDFERFTSSTELTRYVIRKSINSLHPHLTESSLRLTVRKVICPGEVLIGGCGNLINISTPDHTSWRVIPCDLYSIKLE